jgi:hypothetical protein
MPMIPWEAISAGGAPVLLGVTVFLIVVGWLIPARIYRQLERDRDYWRQVAQDAMGHTTALMPVAHIVTEVTRALGEATVPAKTVPAEEGAA